MSTIQRWECPIHGENHGIASVVGDARYCQHCRIPASKLVEVEYVPVSQLHEAERALRVFQAGLTDALRAHNVPAMPSWAEAIHWLAKRTPMEEALRDLVEAGEGVTETRNYDAAVRWRKALDAAIRALPFRDQNVATEGTE